ncbi:diaminobutyrate--2-oxoglutarate transaminase [Candidatus Marithrix sp. Canyon 246]|uniref:diaminobutyrate--2-oxoglutarate transaminase n=1 Tax=Candidatus Marithrix sp. Canyon 246 TaxID=1827136 RepID=UPI00084A0000|nr:diaminobutyrate--2-oxoglutarate transaminase [Candidatus Marithrix sp. Canyon 246]
MSTQIFTEIESNVRSYCRTFPVVFTKAKDAILYTESEQQYIDFFAGAGALNYGHNNDYLKQKLIEYLSADFITHGLDLYTSAKREFLIDFNQYILKPRKLDYKVHFCGPTGTNAVEAAFKLARKVKGRSGIFAFMGGFHGMTLGSLAATGNKYNRAAAGVPLNNITFMPYPHGFMASFDTIEYISNVLNDPNSGIEKPAAMILETTQAEGGVIVAPSQWLRSIKALCEEHDILLICDDIQTGCGRTGTFFSFERAGIMPDIVLLSKSISGYGIPFSLALYKPELDVWEPAEHNGTFRGNQLAFVTGTAALEHYWSNNKLVDEIKQKENYLRTFMENEIQPLCSELDIRGLGLIWGIDMSKLGKPNLAQAVTKCGFASGLVIECSGRNDQVIKLLPPLIINQKLLAKGCQILKQALIETLDSNALLPLSFN